MPDETFDTTAEREQSLLIAVDLHRGRHKLDIISALVDQEMIKTASLVYEYLTGPVELTLTVGPIIKIDTGEVVDRPIGGNGMAQIHDDEKIEFTVTAKSKRGNEVPDVEGPADDISWSLEGDGADAALVLTTSADSRKATVAAKGPVGSGVLRASFSRNGLDRFVTVAVDVVPGDVETLELSAGTVSKIEETTPEEPDTSV